MTKYTHTAIALHWLMAIGLISVFSLGLYMSDLPFSPEKLKFFSWHKWAGISLFLLALLRLSWRITHQAPPLHKHMSQIEKLIAHISHALLYVLIIIIPLSGWLMSSAKGVQTVFFGLLPLPDLLQKNKLLGEQLETLHWGLNMLLAAIVIGHSIAALKHHFIDKDDVLSRMLPKFRKY